MKKTRSLAKVKNSKPSVNKTNLIEDLRNIIEQAKRSVASVVNTHLIALNWQMGRRIHFEILKKKRAGYGEEILATVSQQLTKEYGQGFTISTVISSTFLPPWRLFLELIHISHIPNLLK